MERVGPRAAACGLRARAFFGWRVREMSSSGQRWMRVIVVPSRAPLLQVTNARFAGGGGARGNGETSRNAPRRTSKCAHAQEAEERTMPIVQ
jgi:hypothetical protein